MYRTYREAAIALIPLMALVVGYTLAWLYWTEYVAGLHVAAGLVLFVLLAKRKR